LEIGDEPDIGRAGMDNGTETRRQAACAPKKAIMKN
jgi:hypothetical protein